MRQGHADQVHGRSRSAVRLLGPVRLVGPGGTGEAGGGQGCARRRQAGPLGGGQEATVPLVTISLDPAQSALLAALALAGGEPCDAPRLAEALSVARPSPSKAARLSARGSMTLRTTAPSPTRPGSAATGRAGLGLPAVVSAASVSALVTELRTRLAAAGLAGAVVTTAAGHRLRLPVDADDFRREVRAAREVLATRREAAVPLFDAALDRWSGAEPAEGCRLGGWAAAELSGLRELRLAAVEDRWAVVLDAAAVDVRAAGAPIADREVLAADATAVDTAVAAAAALIPYAEAHPLRERLWELLLVALTLAGRRREALRRYAGAEREFAQQLGVPPGERLRAVAAAVHAGDLGDLPAPEVPVAGPPATSVPATRGRAEAKPDHEAAPGHEAASTNSQRRPKPAPDHKPASHQQPASHQRPATNPMLVAQRLPPRDHSAQVPSRPVAPLPVPLTPLIGREHLLRVVADRIAGHRVVTLTGPGGAGKTRLAVGAAGASARAGGLDAWFVDLSTVDSPVRVPAAIAAALGVRDGAGRELVDGVAERIGALPRLLVLDNCEQVVTGCAELVARLLSQCPGLRVLATSRAPLGVDGEAIVSVPPLAVPPPAVRTLAQLAEVPAARLFLDRARARVGGGVPESAAGAVAQLCVELDGLPLALGAGRGTHSVADGGRGGGAAARGRRVAAQPGPHGAGPPPDAGCRRRVERRTAGTAGAGVAATARGLRRRLRRRRGRRRARRRGPPAARAGGRVAGRARCPARRCPARRCPARRCPARPDGPGRVRRPAAVPDARADPPVRRIDARGRADRGRGDRRPPGARRVLPGAGRARRAAAARPGAGSVAGEAGR